MKVVRLLALISIICAPRAFAVTESVAAEPLSDCSSALVSDPFFKLVEKALETQLLSPEQVSALAKFAEPRNPLRALPKRNVALLNGMEKELQTMTAPRWAALRLRLEALALGSAAEDAIRTDSSQSTKRLLDMRPLVGRPIELVNLNMGSVRWFQEGDRVVAVVRSSEPSKVVFDSGGLKIVNLQGLEHGIGSPEGSTWDYAWNFNGAPELISPSTLETKKLAKGDFGGFTVRGQYFVLSKAKESVSVTVVRARRLGNSRWRPFQARVNVAGYVQNLMEAIGGPEEGYLASTYELKGSKLSVHRFDGKKFTKVELPPGPVAEFANPKMQWGQDGNLFLLVRYKIDIGMASHFILYKIKNGKLLEKSDLGTEFDNGRFWKNEEGRLGLFLEKGSEVQLRFLEGNGPSEYRAFLPPGYLSPIGAFRFGGSYAVALYDLDKKIRILHLGSGTVAASFDIAPIDHNHNRYALISNPSGAVYLIAEQHRSMVYVYTLTVDPDRK